MYKPLFLLALGLALAVPMRAGAGDDVQKLILSGHYEDAVSLAEEALKAAPSDETLHLLRVRGLLTVGKYAEASAAAADGLTRVPDSIRLRWISRETALCNGQPEVAAKMSSEIRQYVSGRSYLFRDPANLVIFGRAALLLGADPKDVMDRVLTAAETANPKLRDVYLAKGELALEKHDFDLASKAYLAGLKQFPDDPDFHYGLAQAYADGDRAAMIDEVEAALKANPRHVPSLLLGVDQAIAAEDYAEAAKLVEEVKAVNPWQPEAWAYSAVLAHLNSDPVAEKERRATALRFWPTNPQVDWLIGKKLAEKYRFAESAACERQALQFDPGYLPAKEELANDLLRTGDEAEGWQLALEVHAKDGYDVEAYNLATLHDTMAKYSTLSNGDFTVYMTTPEAKAYGERVLWLLGRAKKTLSEKYGVELVRPTYIEIFGDQKDFAVRTFGVPNIGGFLGVCFGRVVTANGPAANVAQPSNWETVLWHEFCHVVTLQITQNKMPRWLSEGISVYEESQADPSWGMHMDPRYREMILGKGLTQIETLSAAFLIPKSPLHLQFAYFESSLVVRYLIERYGLDSLKGILRDLGNGIEINKAIAAHTENLSKLEDDFASYARGLAQELAPKLDWKRPDPELLEPGAEQKYAEWVAGNPGNYWAIRSKTRELIEGKHWAEAQTVLEQFIKEYPTQSGPESAYAQLASVYRALDETEQERATLAKFVELDPNATDACLRLMDIGEKAKDWAAVKHYAERYLQVNPLVVPPYRYLAESSQQLGETAVAIAADRTLLQLGPPNPVEVHFQLAQLLHRTQDPEARRQVLQALEDAPRYRDALALLLEINRPSDSPNPSSSHPPDK